MMRSLAIYTVALAGSMFICNGTVLSQLSPEQIEEKLAIHHLYFPQEKVYVHHDKPQYVLGETMWYKVYLLDAIFHQPLTPSQQVRVELFDPDENLVSDQVIRVDSIGAAGDIDLSPDWPAGKYLLRASTAYQFNFAEPFVFQKEILILDAYELVRNPELSAEEVVSSVVGTGNGEAERSEITVLFFPEGGDLLAGLTTTVGVNAIDANGKGVKVRGNVLNRGGDVVARFTTHETGLGFFNLKPIAGEIYQAEMIWHDEVITLPLPGTKTRGYNLRISEKQDTLTLTAQTNIPGGLDGTFLVGHLRGDLFGTISGLQGENITLRVPLAETPSGILHFTLFRPDGQPVSERLFFAYRPEKLPEVTLDLPRDAFNRREKVTLALAAADETFVHGSLVVSDLRLATPNELSGNIETYLLLESDLRGRIPNPGFFFKDNAASRKLRDILMLTHGWRRFDWNDVLSDPNVDVAYTPESSLTLEGFVTKQGRSDKPVQALVFMSLLSQEFAMQEAVTGDDGVFKFTGFEFYEPTPILLQAQTYKEGKTPRGNGDGETIELKGNRWVDLFVTQPEIMETDTNDILKELPPDPNILDEYFASSRRLQTVDSAYSNLISVTLDEVVIAEEAYDPVTEYHKNMILYSEPSDRMVMDSVITQGALSQNILEYLRGRLPGVDILGQQPNLTARIRGINSITQSTTAAFMIDGMFVDPFLVNSIPIDQVAFVDVIRGPIGSAVFGEQGRSGIIAIYRKSPDQMAKTRAKPGSLNYIHPGYYAAKTFYSPDYGENPDNEKPDFRITLFWEPYAIIESGEQSVVEFYTSDKTGIYSVRYEGITTAGEAIVKQATFEVR